MVEDSGLINQLNVLPTKRKYRIIKPDGSVRWISVSLSKKEYLNRDCSIAVANDITDEVKKNTEIQQFFTILQKLNEIVWVGKFDNNNIISYVYINDSIESITGYSKNKFMNREINMLSLVTPDHQDFIRKWKKNKITPMQFEHKIVTKENNIRWMQTNISSFIGADGDLLYYGTHIDITGQKTLYQDIESYKKAYSADIESKTTLKLARKMKEEGISLDVIKKVTGIDKNKV